MSAPILHLSIWQRPVFLLNSRLGLFTAAPSLERPFSLSYGTNLPSSLTTLLPLALEFSSYLPVSVCGTGEAERRSRCTYGRYSVTAEGLKQRDTLKGHDPGVGRPGRKGPKFSREACLDGGEKSFVYI